MNSHGSSCGHVVRAVAAVYFQGIVDPTTIQNPEPGDGLDVLLYLPEMVLSIRIYAVVAIATRRTNRRA
jgi:hypothetical protein